MLNNSQSYRSDRGVFFASSSSGQGLTRTLETWGQERSKTESFISGEGGERRKCNKKRAGNLDFDVLTVRGVPSGLLGWGTITCMGRTGNEGGRNQIVLECVSGNYEKSNETSASLIRISGKKLKNIRKTLNLAIAPEPEYVANKGICKSNVHTFQTLAV